MTVDNALKRGCTVAIQTARKGSKSVLNKNELLIDGEPLYVANLKQAKHSELIDEVFISTDIASAEHYCAVLGCGLIKRTFALAGDDASHHETIKVALLEAEQILGKTADILVVLLGNNRCAFSADLDRAISMLQEHEDIDSVISVGKYNMFNPLRAYRLGHDGLLENFFSEQSVLLMNNKLSNDKDAVGDVYFFNGSFWVMRRACFMSNDGLLPFPWLGKRIKTIVQDPRCMEIDDFWQQSIVEQYGA